MCPAGQERYSKSASWKRPRRSASHMQETIYEMLRERRSVWFG